LINKWKAMVFKFYLFFLNMELKLCKFVMKFGISRYQYCMLLFFSYIVVDIITDTLWGTISPVGVAVRLIIYLIIFSFSYDYPKWLKDKSIGLDTFKVVNMHFRERRIDTFTSIVNWSALLFVVFIYFYVVDPALLVSSILTSFLIFLYLACLTNSGPPEPDSTIWSKAKEKIKSFAKSLNRPILIPQPIGV